MTELEKAYDHSKVEEKIYKMWETSGFFNPDKLPGERKKPYTIIMPPPNANAPMHLGHALFVTIEDILIRYKRMQGCKALWLPGEDHAGFETQVVFEKKLEKEGRSRFKMQREEFYKEIWDFVQANKHITENGLRRLGASCDWDRNIFTLDPEIVKVVYQTFKQMYDDGLVYRGDRLGNWCFKHQTALSDLETKYEERVEPFYYFKYGPFTISTSRPETKFGDKYVVMHPDDKRYAQYKNGDTFEAEWINGPIKATVIKDGAVDMEFGSGVMTITPWHDPVDFDLAQKHKLDKEQIIDKFGKLLPIAGEFAGMKTAIARPLIVEKLKSKGLLEKVDEKYKHNVQVCYKCGTIIEPQIIPQWFVAMAKPLPDGRPSLRDMAVKAIQNKEVEIVTEKFEKIFMNWMENLRDWPISRQIWWGIPIPVWYKKKWDLKIYDGNEIFESLRSGKKHFETRAGKPEGSDKDWKNFKTGDIVTFTLVDEKTEKQLPNAPIIKQISSIQHFSSVDDLLNELNVTEVHPYKPEEYRGWWESRPKFKERIEKYGIWAFELRDCEKSEDLYIGTEPPKSGNWERDPDTFDTWFSSGQWPYATLMANDIKRGTEDFKNYFPTQVMETGWDILFFWVARMVMMSYYRTNKSPFEKVYLHGLVRDKDRQKMSKSKGNVIDPLGVIDTYGCDALRFALIFSTSAGNDIPLAEDKIKGMKHFANKLWNIARFILSYDDVARPVMGDQAADKSARYIAPDPKTGADKEILAKLNQTVKNVTDHLDAFRLHEAAQELYQFTWYEFADIYIEASKKQLSDDKLKENTLFILHYSLFTILKLLHPFMPFVTEEIWSKLNQKELLMISDWPK